jgi:hypothetical protein
MTQPPQPPAPSGFSIPGWHIAMGLSGWILYLFATHPVTLVLAIILSLLAVPRFIRGPWEKADKRITERLNQPQAPTKRVAHIMLHTEKLLWEAADHPISLLGWYLCWALATVGAWALLVYVTWGQWFLWTVLILWILIMLWVLLKTIIQRRNRLCLTDKRVLVIYGLFTTNHEMMPLSKMTNEQLEIPWHSNLLSWLRIISTQYGTMKPDSAGEEGRLGHVKFIRYAIQVNRIVMERALG